VYLPLFSAGFAALAMMFYVVLDGFDLGVGTLLLFESAQASRSHMVDSIAPTWDGNETWLIMAGITLFAAFPIAYAILMPALYLPIVIMLLALGLRGVSFEFRAQSKLHRRQWDHVFGVGSVVAAFMQGLILGALFQGVKVEDLRFAGSVLDVFRPFPIISGVTLVVGYSVLGSGWLYMKANAFLQRFAVHTLQRTAPAFLALFCVACIYAAEIQPGVREAWGSHTIVLGCLVGLFVLVAVALTMLAGKCRAILPFSLGLMLFLLGISGMALIFFPNIVPFDLSLWSAAASTMSQIFVLVGAAVVSPVVLAYSAFAYWIFRGRTPEKGWAD
jgi:cytochrome d ubiquinol oxidase subunit II